MFSKEAESMMHIERGREGDQVEITAKSLHAAMKGKQEKMKLCHFFSPRDDDDEIDE